ncbi:hypothetical protein ACWGB8_02135 [Kitasatospora sp. NPDC054939]
MTTNTATWSVVSGPSPDAHAVEPAPHGITIPETILDWASTHGLDIDDPDIYLLVTPQDEEDTVDGEIAYLHHPMEEDDMIRLREALAPDEPGPHFTAWVTTDTSCLDQPNIDVDVLADTIHGYNASGPVWTSSTTTLTHLTTTVPAADGDGDKALKEAKDLLAEAGWTLTGTWDAVDTGFVATVERDADETWTAEEIAHQIGASSPDYARTLMSRLGVKSVARQPGRAGQALYPTARALYAHGTRLGQGARTDRKDSTE